ncbi:hypothetical protein [Streptomyces sp. NPDC096030]|uniref:hypothetical protein n=1 Tax=Streptomyces sp. NPDC096030 TaxID=3155423 RepID=UPI00333334CE
MLTIKVYRANAPEAPLAEYKVQPVKEIPASHAFAPCECPQHARGRRCDFHKGRSSTAEAADEHHYACAPCREQRGLSHSVEQVQR